MVETILYLIVVIYFIVNLGLAVLVDINEEDDIKYILKVVMVIFLGIFLWYWHRMRKKYVNKT